MPKVPRQPAVARSEARQPASARSVARQPGAQRSMLARNVAKKSAATARSARKKRSPPQKPPSPQGKIEAKGSGQVSLEKIVDEVYGELQIIRQSVTSLQERLTVVSTKLLMAVKSDGIPF